MSLARRACAVCRGEVRAFCNPRAVQRCVPSGAASMVACCVACCWNLAEELAPAEFANAAFKHVRHGGLLGLTFPGTKPTTPPRGHRSVSARKLDINPPPNNWNELDMLDLAEKRPSGETVCRTPSPEPYLPLSGARALVCAPVCVIVRTSPSGWWVCAIGLLANPTDARSHVCCGHVLRVCVCAVVSLCFGAIGVESVYPRRSDRRAATPPTVWPSLTTRTKQAVRAKARIDGT